MSVLVHIDSIAVGLAPSGSTEARPWQDKSFRVLERFQNNRGRAVSASPGKFPLKRAEARAPLAFGAATSGHSFA